MTTEEMIEQYISEGVKAYKKLNRNTPEGRKLDRKEPVNIEGIEFSCWREYATYKVAECIHETLPTVKIDVDTYTLEGSNAYEIFEAMDKIQNINGFIIKIISCNKTWCIKNSYWIF